MPKHTLEFVKEKETTNALRYQEMRGDSRASTTGKQVVGPLYIRKSQLPDDWPEKLKVTIDY